MHIALTGATGFVGSHILAELPSAGHEVTALVRDDADAAKVAARGAETAAVDLYDRPAVVKLPATPTARFTPPAPATPPAPTWTPPSPKRRSRRSTARASRSR